MAEDGAGGDPGGSAGTRPCPGWAGRMHHRMHHPPGAGQVRTGRQGGPRGLAWLFPVLDCGCWSCDCVPRPLSDKQEEDGGGSCLQVQKEERRLVCREIGPFWCLTNAAWSRASCPSAREASVGGGGFWSYCLCFPHNVHPLFSVGWRMFSHSVGRAAAFMVLLFLLFSYLWVTVSHLFFLLSKNST